MNEPDLSAIGVDAPLGAKPTEMARREEQQIVLDQVKEDHDHDLKKRDRDLGAIGKIFGSRENAITYIVALFALMAMIMVAGFSAGSADTGKIAIEFFKAVGFACVGFITGKSFEKKEEK